MRIETVTLTLDLAGVFASALLSGAAARSRRLDLFGYAVTGLVAGLGGGVIRDILLQHASVAVLVASNQVVRTRLGEPVTGTVIGVLSGPLLRLAAYRQDWRLPAGLD